MATPVFLLLRGAAESEAKNVGENHRVRVLQGGSRESFFLNIELSTDLYQKNYRYKTTLISVIASKLVPGLKETGLSVRDKMRNVLRLEI